MLSNEKDLYSQHLDNLTYQEIEQLKKQNPGLRVYGKQNKANIINSLLRKYEKDLTKLGNSTTAVVVVSGVNGVGKTTTIGKMGKYFKDNNKSIVFGAADTFRAAAIDQLQLWATKVRADIIKSEIGSDAASVAFKTAE